MATSSGYDHEVFLSFRGPDARSGIADVLYTNMIGKGIRVYKDDKNLGKGQEFVQELLEAINQSKISIPIFSKNYASSIWCLKEVAQMVECKKSKGQKIMPIFYDVDPKEVRYQTGGYEEAFRSHEKKTRYDKKTISEWKAALKEVSFVHGWDLHSKGENRREGEFAKELTEEVFKELKKDYLAVSDYLVSVDDQVDAIMEMIGAETSETRIIGIHGMGGIGKTTIAKIIYNKLSDNFKNCCFLRDIRETSKSKGIQRLQEQLISDILKEKCVVIKDSDEGIRTIKERLSNKMVLLLLDDAEEGNHISTLIGKRDWFGKGTKIIITTRNKGILDVPEVDKSYELSLMNPTRSLELFSKHAFGRDTPWDDYIDRSKKAVEIAGGLPLALEVIGSRLGRVGKDKDMWDAELVKLERVPRDDVRSKLKISYDALDSWQKLIFLDIACLFIGYDKDILVHFWDESDFFPIVDMKVLQNMSLIKINEYNKVWMHDQLRDLGRAMVREERGTQKEKQSRVWDPEEGLDLLTRHKTMKRLKVLDLSNCNRLERLPNDPCRGLTHLEYLSPARCHSLTRLPKSIGELTSLIELDISLTVIKELPRSIGELRNLKVVKMGCTNISKIPDAFWNIGKLEQVEASGRFGRLHGNIGPGIYENKSLSILKLERADISKLPRLPESLTILHLRELRMETFPDISNLTDLKELDLTFARPGDGGESNGLGEDWIPRWIVDLTKLESLSLNSHYVATVSTDLSLPPHLKSLHLDCPNLGRLPRLPSSLSSLSLQHCESLRSLEDLSNLKNLSSICLEHCESLRSMEDLSNLKKLSSLKIVHSGIAEIQGLGCLENLRELSLDNLERRTTTVFG
ncbi:disease resistance protein L6-like [Rhodamnia argentea]|uniref:Disease resistance protein L6-like n=1 Tax=Rhodamnia argentea TaxID=178133 RepID=A0ABM3HBA9_9MYRT|nr:disease resistance protein L6-like [Rhodamnia argentea]